MARPSSIAQQRGLSLTEELERLEQSITLTLQEIDQNFSIAHRIVTSSILPVVDQYATHSRAVWEGSRFWKQFFESSANVSLSGYEEGDQSSHLQSNVEESVTEEETDTTATHTTLSTEDQSYETPSQQHIHTDSIQDLDLSNLTISPSHSTPRPGRKQQPPQFADYPSPYEALRAEVNTTANIDATSFSQSGPSTPGRRVADLEEIAHTPGTSPALPRQRQHTPSSVRPSTTRKRSDPLLHRVLDKTYRIQATPLTVNRYQTNLGPRTTTPATTTRNPLLDPTLSSSPEIAPPELHAEIFSSPERRHRSPARGPHKFQSQPQVQQPGTRTPGVSILTPARNNKFAAPTRTPGVWDSDSDEENTDAIDEATGLPYGASPPKTIQFHIPQSRLLKTPAKEASRKIVNDVLAAAGAASYHHRTGADDGDTTGDLDDFQLDLDATNYDDVYGDDLDVDVDAAAAAAYGEDHSPSVVRRAVELDDEVF